MFVPLVNMLFWFVPGTAGENRFGKRTPPNTIGVILLACILPVVFVLGILAAIAIPAYQDYTLRAQVSEGLMLASPVKAAIERSYRQTGAAPLDRAAVGLPADASGATGKYVESVDVVDGTILVTYGLEANARLAGRAVALQPYVGPGDSIVWRCGAAPVAGGTVPMAPDAPGADFATEIEPQLLPSGCRP
jgi:type IV pilus assembly protein PilA